MVFNTVDLSWRLHEEKRADYMNDIHYILSSESLDLISCQSILGKLNFVCSMWHVPTDEDIQKDAI